MKHWKLSRDMGQNKCVCTCCRNFLFGVNEILAVLWKGYENLKNDPSIVISSSTEEDDITQDWFVKVQRIWDSRNLATCICLNQSVPHHQYADRTFKKAKGRKSPTIDFCFRDWNTANSYFGAECKNLHALEPKKIRRYVETGVSNYTSGRYGPVGPDCCSNGHRVPADDIDRAIISSWNELVDRRRDWLRLSNKTGDQLADYRIRDLKRLAREYGHLRVMPYALLIRVLDHVEVRTDGKLSVIFLAGIRMDR